MTCSFALLTWDEEPQGLKPLFICRFYGPPKEAAEKPFGWAAAPN